MTNLWNPVTSLIMVQFSIHKKFWKALDLLYQLVVYLCNFPFSQISLQSHVTTLNQPIRSLESQKSTSSRQNLWDFVRFHSNFFPHLKSKAFRTALLKIVVSVNWQHSFSAHVISCYFRWDFVRVCGVLMYYTTAFQHISFHVISDEILWDFIWYHYHSLCQSDFSKL